MQPNSYQQDDRNNQVYSTESTGSEYMYYHAQGRYIDCGALYNYFEGQSNSSFHNQQQWRRTLADFDLSNTDSNSYCAKSTVARSLLSLSPAVNTNNVTTNSDPRQYQSNAGFPKTTPSRSRLTATLWEDEDVAYFQMDCRGICVARRQDNDMVNGTKLLNVAGISRGKRDGILKNERGRVVVKVGAIHLKGVWIPLQRAKVLAAQFRILEDLQPLLSDHPTSYLYPSCIQQLYRKNSIIHKDHQIPYQSFYSNHSSSEGPRLSVDTIAHSLHSDTQHHDHLDHSFHEKNSQTNHDKATSFCRIVQGHDKTMLQ